MFRLANNNASDRAGSAELPGINASDAAMNATEKTRPSSAHEPATR